MQGLFSTKQVHKQDSLVSVNRQHELYTVPLSSWLSDRHQASISCHSVHRLCWHHTYVKLSAEYQDACGAYSDYRMQHANPRVLTSN